MPINPPLDWSLYERESNFLSNGGKHDSLSVNTASFRAAVVKLSFLYEILGLKFPEGTGNERVYIEYNVLLQNIYLCPL